MPLPMISIACQQDMTTGKYLQFRESVNFRGDPRMHIFPRAPQSIVEDAALQSNIAVCFGSLELVFSSIIQDWGAMGRILAVHIMGE